MTANASERIAVSVDMLSTGYNCRDLLNIGLFRPVFSPTEYIQIKGRGTRRYTFISRPHRLREVVLLSPRLLRRRGIFRRDNTTTPCLSSCRDLRARLKQTATKPVHPLSGPMTEDGPVGSISLPDAKYGERASPVTFPSGPDRDRRWSLKKSVSSAPMARRWTS